MIVVTSLITVGLLCWGAWQIALSILPKFKVGDIVLAGVMDRSDDLEPLLFQILEVKGGDYRICYMSEGSWEKRSVLLSKVFIDGDCRKLTEAERAQLANIIAALAYEGNGQ